MNRRLLWVLVGVAGLAVIVLAVGADPGGDAEPAGDDDRVAAAEPTTAATGGVTITSDGAPGSTSTIAPAATTGATGSVPAPTAQSTVATSTAPGPAGRVPEGAWGGAGIRLVVSSTGASVEYDCATGLVTEALVVDGGGSFAASGTHAFQSGGPATPGAPAPPGRPARYSGSIRGSQMTLTVVVPDTGTTLGPFTLGLGEPPLLDRCG